MKPNKGELKNKFDLVVVGCSAGGIDALKVILAGIPFDFKVPLVIIQHRGVDSQSFLIQYFSDFCDLKVLEPEDKEPMVGGCIYFAPANYHLLIAADKCFNLSVDEAIHYSRPSVDVCFQSAADVFNKRTLGVILSGANADGAAGLKTIKEAGGLTLVQDPQTALHPQMPQAAFDMAAPDFILTLEEIRDVIHAI